MRESTGPITRTSARPHWAGGARVLVVDDDDAIRHLCRVVLESAGYVVSVAANGADALRLVREMPMDLVVCDIFMPEMDGIETISELGKHWQACKVIAISGGSGDLPDFLPVARHLGALRTLAKPFTPLALLSAVGSALDENQDA